MRSRARLLDETIAAQIEFECRKMLVRLLAVVRALGFGVWQFCFLMKVHQSTTYDWLARVKLEGNMECLHPRHGRKNTDAWHWSLLNL